MNIDSTMKTSVKPSRSGWSATGAVKSENPTLDKIKVWKLLECSLYIINSVEYSEFFCFMKIQLNIFPITIQMSGKTFTDEFWS